MTYDDRIRKSEFTSIFRFACGVGSWEFSCDIINYYSYSYHKIIARYVLQLHRFGNNYNAFLQKIAFFIEGMIVQYIVP